MKRDDDKIRVQLDSTVGDFKCISSELDKIIKLAIRPQEIMNIVTKFKTMLDNQIMKP